MNLDLRLTESEEILRTAAINFLKRDINKATLEALHESDTGFNEDIWRKVVDMGWLGIITPEEYGGTGYPLITAGVLFEALGSAPLPGPYFSSGILGSLILQEIGTEGQKKEILPQVAEGKIVLSTILTEAELGWHSEVQVERKNGDFILNVGKGIAHDASAATHLIVPVRTGENNSFSLFLVDKKMSGVSIRKLPGYLIGRTFEVRLDAVKLPPEALIGEADKVYASLLKAIKKAIPVLCAYKVGGCQAVFDLAVEHSRVRVQFGQSIGRFQRVQDMIIDIINQVDAARWTTYEALWKLDTQGLIPESIHLAKAVTSEAYWQSCNQAHRAISGIGYSTEHPLSLHTKASRYLYNFLGEPAYHKQQLAKLLLS
ncbi:MAG: acyl-CoA dehydrogenase family protein [Thermodesulfobacteriota bacterium]|jgi:alkylation response protein AidB-like acyl-CoA dehydrogenase